MKNKVLILLVIFLLTISTVSASVAIQLKETVPGIVMKQTALLKYDIVNMDTEHMIKGFLVCQSSDDIRITSSFGAGIGTGQQYVSPFLTFDKGPFQSAMTLTIDADSTGDKNPGCVLKYIPYKEVAGGGGISKIYLKINGEYISELKDADYRELRLDKTAPFVTGMKDPQCPEGKEHCKANEVIDMAQITEVIIKEVPKEEKPEEITPPRELSRGIGISGTSILLGLFAIIGIIFIIYVVFSLSKKASKKLKKPKKHCSECGTSLAPGEDFCPKCGEKI